MRSADRFDVLAELLCDLLALWGYETDTAADGHDGLRCLAERPYAAVVTDFKMPGISGLAVAARVIPRLPEGAGYLDVSVPGRPVAGPSTLDSQVEVENSISTVP